MSQARTLTASLDAVAHRTDGGYSHLVQEKEPARFVPYAEIARRARRFGAALQAAGVRRGERVGLILPDSSEFVEAIFGAMYAGAIAVPIYPPMNLGQFEAYLGNTTHILRQAGCSLLVTDARVRPILGKLMSSVPSVRSVEVYSSFVKQVDERAAPIGVDVKPDDVAFLQFTSGSTSRPWSPTSRRSAGRRGCRSRRRRTASAGCRSITTWGSSASCSRRSTTTSAGCSSSRR